MQLMMYFCSDSQIIFTLFSNQQSMHDPVIVCICLWVCVCVCVWLRIRFCCFSEGWVWSVCVREGSGRSGCILSPGGFLSTRTFVVMHLSCRLAVCDFLIFPGMNGSSDHVCCWGEMHYFHLMDQKTSEKPQTGPETRSNSNHEKL